MIIAINGQQTELRGAQSPSEGACMRAALGWALAVTMQPSRPQLIDVRCVWSS